MLPPLQLNTAAARWSRPFFNLLAAKVGGGTSIVMATVIATNALRIVSSVVLTRLLDAQAFGIMGIISFFAFALMMISDTGIFAFVIRHKNGQDPVFLDRIWTIRLARGLLLTLGMAVLSGPFSAYAQKPELQAAIIVWSFTFALEGVSSMSFATAVRKQVLTRLSVFDLGISVFQTALSIVIALYSASYWSLIVAMLITSAVRTIMSYTVFPDSSRQLDWSRETMSELWGFSRLILVSSIMTVIISQLDKVFFARTFTLSEFGFYTIAVTLATAPLALVSPFAHKILYPFLANINLNDEACLRDNYYKRVATVVPLYAFLVGGLIGASPLVVELLYDARYLSIASLVRWLAISSMFAMCNACAEQLMVVIGKTAVVMAGNFIRLCFIIVGAGTALLTQHSFVLVVFVGLLEIPVLLFLALARIKLDMFRFRGELPALLAGGTGVVLGIGGSTLALRLYHSF